MFIEKFGSFLEPFSLLFFSVALGSYIGKLRFFKITLGSSAVLFIALPLGWLAQSTASLLAVDMHYPKALISSELLNFFLIMFVASVGLLASKDLAYVLKQFGIKFVVMGLSITGIGAILAKLASWFIPELTVYHMSGVYTGALTSSPGLAAALEVAQTNMTEIELLQGASAEIGLGYAISYPFGVMIVILAMTFIPFIFKIDLESEKREYMLFLSAQHKSSEKVVVDAKKFDCIGFAIVCLLGYILGTLKVDMTFLGLQPISLGATGGVLMIALLLGALGKTRTITFRMSPLILTQLREWSLVLFLATIGLNYGYSVFQAFSGVGLIIIFVSVSIALISMLVGFFIGRYLFKLNWILLSGAICGGMTSTPGLGAAIDAVSSDDPAAGYGAAYPFALMGMVMYTILLQSV